jgi:hypothetical protein
LGGRTCFWVEGHKAAFGRGGENGGEGRGAHAAIIDDVWSHTNREFFMRRKEMEPQGTRGDTEL